MGFVVTVLEARVADERTKDLQAAYSAAGQDGFPQGLMRSSLLQDANDPTCWRIETWWESHESLKAMRSAGKPRGVQMFNDAGAEPSLRVFSVIAELTPPDAGG